MATVSTTCRHATEVEAVRQNGLDANATRTRLRKTGRRAELEIAVKSLMYLASNPSDEAEENIPVLLSAIKKLAPAGVAVIAESAAAWWTGGLQTCVLCHPKLYRYRMNKFMALVQSIPQLLKAGNDNFN